MEVWSVNLTCLFGSLGQCDQWMSVDARVRGSWIWTSFLKLCGLCGFMTTTTFVHSDIESRHV